MISADDFLQTCSCENAIAKIGKFISTELLSEAKNITNPCLPRVVSRRLVYRSLGYLKMLI